METEQLLELQVEQSEEPAGEEKERRAIQKERDRERRRLRDRQRRKSMSLEEREIHLARRRRNYQLRRQRAANAKLGIVQQKVLTAAAAESNARSECQALDCTLQFAPNEVNQLQNPSDHLNHALSSGTTAWPGQYRYPRVLRLTQIKHLIRLLNCSLQKPCLGNQENGEMTVPNGIPRKGIRLVHLKNLIRMLNSEMSKTTEQNDSDKMQGGGGELDESSSMQRENEGSDDRVLWNENEKTIDAIDENEQICADDMCIL